MPYMIKCWIPVQPEDPETYPTKEDAEMEKESLESMQPENKYEVVEV